MKKLITICLLTATTFTTISYSQEKFNSKEIQLLHNIAKNSSFNNIKKYMEDNNYAFDKKESDESFGEYFFISSNQKSSMLAKFSNSKKLALITLQVPNAIITEAEKVLIENNFENIKIDNETKLWKKRNYYYQYVIQNYPDEPYNSIILLTKESENYTK